MEKKYENEYYSACAPHYVHEHTTEIAGDYLILYHSGTNKAFSSCRAELKIISRGELVSGWCIGHQVEVVWPRTYKVGMRFKHTSGDEYIVARQMDFLFLVNLKLFV